MYASPSLFFRDIVELSNNVEVGDHILGSHPLRVVELGTRTAATGRVRCLWITILTGRYGLAVDFLWCNHGGRDRAGQPRWQRSGRATTVAEIGPGNHGGRDRAGQPRWQRSGRATTVAEIGPGNHGGRDRAGQPRWQRSGRATTVAVAI